MTFDALFNERIQRSLLAFCRCASISMHQAEDFFQEASLAAMVAFKRYYPKHRRDPDALTRLCVRSGTNRVQLLRRRIVMEQRKRKAVADWGRTPKRQPSPESPVIAEDTLRAMVGRLDETARRVLVESLNPGEAVSRAEDADYRRRQNRALQGFLVMFIRQGHVLQDKHIAAGLKLSPATVSRARRRIVKAYKEVTS